ncbi:MAG: hypothetical protein H0W90_14455 [Actinobacteria bacterium]|nr:hypothetical protein [Actinomycetota bacterium]
MDHPRAPRLGARGGQDHGDAARRNAAPAGLAFRAGTGRGAGRTSGEPLRGPRRHPLDPKAAALLPVEVVRRMFVVPVRFMEDGRIEVAVGDPADVDLEGPSECSAGA